MNRSDKIRLAIATKSLTAREVAKAIKADDSEIKFISSFLCTASGLAVTERECSITGRIAKAYVIAGQVAAPVAAPAKAPLPGNGPRCEDQPHKAPKASAAPKSAPQAPKPAAKAKEIDHAALLKLDPTGMINKNLPDNATHTHRFEILSQTSDRIYIVAKSRAKGQWQCSCPGWIHHRHCKHLAALVPFLKAADKEVEQIAG